MQFMADSICPNINTCRMVATCDVVKDPLVKEDYINTWCRKGEEMWGKCKRYNTKKELGFCPDFIVPDTTLSLDEIIDKIENEI